MADFTTRRFVDSYDPAVSYVNLLTASEPGGNTREGPLPLALDSDREAVEVGLFSSLAGAAPRVCRIKNTALLDEVWASEALLEEIKRNPKLEILQPPSPVEFNASGKSVVEGPTMQTIETKLSDQFIRITTKVPPTQIDDRMQTGTTSTLTLDVATLEKELRQGSRARSDSATAIGECMPRMPGTTAWFRSASCSPKTRMM